jgi:hypothetical protein
MMNKILVALIIFLLVVFTSHCTDDSSGIIDNNNGQLPEGIAGITSFDYHYLETAPIHTQTSMLSGYQNKLYRFGSKWPVQVLDLVSKNWSEIQVPDSSFWRWDGAAVTIADSIFIVATSDASNSYDIIKVDLLNLSLHHTNVNLPNYFHYPAYCTYNDLIIFFSLKTDSVFEYNSRNSELKKVAENPFINSTDYNLTLSSGKFESYFYVFGGYSEIPSNLFYRLNLFNYQWEKLYIPPVLEQKRLFGSSFANQLVLFKDSVSTYEYSFIDMNWYIDTSRVPIYTRSLNGQLMRGEWSFYAEDSCLFGTENISDKVWKIIN